MKQALILLLLISSVACMQAEQHTYTAVMLSAFDTSLQGHPISKRINQFYTTGIPDYVLR